MQAKLRITLTPNATTYTDPGDNTIRTTLELLDCDSDGTFSLTAEGAEFSGDYYTSPSGVKYPLFNRPTSFAMNSLKNAGDTTTTAPGSYVSRIWVWYKSNVVATMGYYPSDFPTNNPYFYRVTYNNNGLVTTNVTTMTGSGTVEPVTLDVVVNDVPAGVGTLNVSGDAGIAEVYYNGNTYYPRETTVSIPLVSDATALGIQSASPAATINANETVQKVQVGSKVYTSFPATVKGSPGETMGITVTAAPYPEITVKYEGTKTPVVADT